MQTRDKRKSNRQMVLQGIQTNYKRQKEIFDPKAFVTSITIAGLGNIGSQTGIALTRLGLDHIHLFDFDNVEIHNIASQSYSIKDLNLAKPLALAKEMSEINPNIKTFNYCEKYNGDYCLTDILIIAVDSMKERRRICENLKKCDPPKFIIDGRMGGPQLEIYSCQTLKEWEDTFVDNPSNDPCGARYICYTSMIIGALIANQVKRYLKKEPYKKEIIFNINSLQMI